MCRLFLRGPSVQHVLVSAVARLLPISHSYWMHSTEHPSNRYGLWVSKCWSVLVLCFNRLQSFLWWCLTLNRPTSFCEEILEWRSAGGVCLLFGISGNYEIEMKPSLGINWMLGLKEIPWLVYGQHGVLSCKWKRWFTFSFIKGNRKSVVDRERALPRLPALPYRRDEICWSWVVTFCRNKAEPGYKLFNPGWDADG